jgi:hypothetical protein
LPRKGSSSTHYVSRSRKNNSNLALCWEAQDLWVADQEAPRIQAWDGKISLLKGLQKTCIETYRKHCSLAKEVLTGHCTLRGRLHVMDPAANAMCKKSGQEEESSKHIFLVPRADRYEQGLFQKHVLALALRIGPFWNQGRTVDPVLVWVFGAVRCCLPPMPTRNTQ